jgi:enamine deaminase RidA (YjgF/YER057c/UK114 family)
MNKQRLMPKGHWDWSMPVKFSQGWKVGDLIFVGGQISADAHGRTVGKGDIATQTRAVFENIRTVLKEAGADLKDIVRLNTYYQQRGEGPEITRFWEEMTRVRMEYLADPGPVGTAVRVVGFAFEDLLIEIEAIAALGPRQRLMPKGHWDWSMKVPFSQGWKIDNLIFVGGQISADNRGRTIGKGDIALQTRNVFEAIRRVLNEAGADLDSIVKLNTYYCQPDTGTGITRFWEAMTRVRMEYLADPGPVGTAVRVEGFAYEDLLIEIEAIAALGPKTRLMPENHWDWSIKVPFSQGWKVGDLIFVGGQISADNRGRTIGKGDIARQTRNAFGFIRGVLNEGGADVADLVKLNTYYQFAGEGEQVTRFWEDMTKVRMEYLADPGPAATAVRVAGFAYEDLLIEIEGIAAVQIR